MCNAVLFNNFSDVIERGPHEFHATGYDRQMQPNMQRTHESRE